MLIYSSFHSTDHKDLIGTRNGLFFYVFMGALRPVWLFRCYSWHYGRHSLLAYVFGFMIVSLSWQIHNTPWPAFLLTITCSRYIEHTLDSHGFRCLLVTIHADEFRLRKVNDFLCREIKIISMLTMDADIWKADVIGPVYCKLHDILPDVFGYTQQSGMEKKERKTSLRNCKPDIHRLNHH